MKVHKQGEWLKRTFLLARADVVSLNSGRLVRSIVRWDAFPPSCWDEFPVIEDGTTALLRLRCSSYPGTGPIQARQYYVSLRNGERVAAQLNLHITCSCRFLPYVFFVNYSEIQIYIQFYNYTLILKCLLISPLPIILSFFYNPPICYMYIINIIFSTVD